MKGAEIIAEYLIRERVPYAVGLCGHGDLGLLDALYERRERDRARCRCTTSRPPDSSPTRTTGSGTEPLATFTSVRPRVGEPAGRARLRAHGLLGLPGDHRQRADHPVQPGAVPGDRTALPGGRPGRAAPLRQAQLPGDPGRPAPVDAAAGVRGHAHRPARAGAPGRAARRVRGDLRRAGARPRPVAAGASPPGAAAADDDVDRDLDLLLAARAAADRGRVRRAERRAAPRNSPRSPPAPGIPVVTSPLGQGRRGPAVAAVSWAPPGATAPTRPTGRPAAPT